MGWTFTNLVAGYVLTYFQRDNMSDLLIALTYGLVVFQLVKLAGSIVYYLKLKVIRSEMKKHKRENKVKAPKESVKRDL